MNPDNNQNQPQNPPPTSPQPGASAPVPPVSQPYQQPAQPTQAPVPPPQPWNDQSFYGRGAGDVQTPRPTVLAPPPPPPPQGPIALTLPMWIHDHLKILILSIIGVIILMIIVFQIVYPSSRLLPGTVVDGVKLDYMRKQDAVAKLNEAYGEMKFGIYFGTNQAAFQTPKFKEAGIGVNTESYLAPFEYPWYLRVVPTSFFWAGGLNKTGELEYVYDKQKIDVYIKSAVGDDCTIPARDASLKLVGEKLQLIPSRPGGVCDITKFQQALATTEPKAVGENKVTIDIRETAALVDDDKAQVLAGALNDRAATPMPIGVLAGSQTIAGRSVLSWLDFKSFIPETPAGQPRDDDRIRNGSKLTFIVNRDRMGTFMAGDIGKKVAIKPGVTKIATTDFTVTSHVNGQPGRELDKDNTALSIENYLNRKLSNAKAETKPIQPGVSYARKYTPTDNGFAAMFAQWPEEHPGTYAMSLVEISGIKPFRKANYRGDQPMLAAGTEAGYVAYAMLLGQRNNTILSNDKISGSRTPEQCFKDMIERTDLDCIKGFLLKIGHETMVARGQELGLKGTIFNVDGSRTSTEDLVYFLNQAYLTKIAPTANGGRILSTMQTTRLKDGIKAGIVKGTVSNLAGESGTVHNDAAVVYTPKGVYLFAVMSEGASRADIAELTKKVDALHNISPPKKK